MCLGYRPPNRLLVCTPLDISLKTLDRVRRLKLPKVGQPNIGTHQVNVGGEE
jgi:hypothetical protein